MLSDCHYLNRLTGYRGRREKMRVKDLRQRSGLAWFCACADSCVVFNTGPYTVLPDNSILITANMQLETGFPSSHQLTSYVASKSRLKLAARAVLSADAGLLVTLCRRFDVWMLNIGITFKGHSKVVRNDADLNSVYTTIVGDLYFNHVYLYCCIPLCSETCNYDFPSRVFRST